MARSPEDRRLPAPVPAAAKAAISPSALVLGGAGVAAGLVIGLPAAVAVALGAGAWGVRVGLGAAVAGFRRRQADRPEAIDPYAVGEPWRSFVRESLTAQAKFDQAVARSRPGPLRDRLAAVSIRIRDGVRECWRVAHLGAALDAALAALNPEAVSQSMRRLQEGRPPVTSAAARQDSEAAMAAQLQAGRRVEAAAQRAIDRLRVLTAELNAAVASAVELSLDATDPQAAGQLAGQVDSVVGELETLRYALEETAGTPSPRPL